MIIVLIANLLLAAGRWGGVLRDGTRDGESERTFWGVHNLDSFGRDALDDNWRFPRHHETKTKGEVIVWPAGKANIVCVSCPVSAWCYKSWPTDPHSALFSRPANAANQRYRDVWCLCVIDEAAATSWWRAGGRGVEKFSTCLCWWWSQKEKVECGYSIAFWPSVLSAADRDINI